MSVMLWAVAAVAVTVAVVTDVRSRRIPNWLTAGLTLAALVLTAFAGIHSLLVALATMSVTFVLGTLAFACGWLGGGDVKLIAALGAVLGWPDTAALLLYTAIGGGLLALIVAGAAGRLGSTLRATFALALPLLYPGVAATAPTEGVKLPYAVAIAFGTLCVAVSHTYVPMLRLAL
ncbi:hypothetical protein EPN52_14225 [bacterium]|nr:MAG: hypothetical protein EPN52_14225 [bacterium]